jgi:hypothetical protein
VFGKDIALICAYLQLGLALRDFFPRINDLSKERQLEGTAKAKVESPAAAGHHSEDRKTSEDGSLSKVAVLGGRWLSYLRHFHRATAA